MLLPPFTGVISKVMPVRQGVSQSGKNWAAQEYVIICRDGDYDDLQCFELFGLEKISEYNIQYGDTVTVEARLTTREYNGKYFHKVSAAKVTVVARAAQPQAQPQARPQVQPQAPVVPIQNTQPTQQTFQGGQQQLFQGQAQAQPQAQASAPVDATDDLPF